MAEERLVLLEMKAAGGKVQKTEEEKKGVGGIGAE